MSCFSVGHCRRCLLSAPGAIAVGASILSLAMPAGWARGQQVNHSVGFPTLSQNSFEQIGVNFNYQSPNFFFTQNSAALAAPQFGGASPPAGAQAGFAVPVLGGLATFGITASQGSRSSLTSQTASLTSMNGVPGGVFDTTQTPFVTGVVPVVGNFSDAISPLAERLQRLQQEGAAESRPANDDGPMRGRGAPNGGAAADGPRPAAGDGFAQKLAVAQASSAGRPTLSVAELRELRAQQATMAEQGRLGEAKDLAARAQSAEEAGKLTVARLYYQQAARRVEGPQADALLAQARRLERAEKSARSPASHSGSSHSGSSDSGSSHSGSSHSRSSAQ